MEHKFVEGHQKFPISYLLIIVFFFFRACEAKCLALKNILSLYEKASSQTVNFYKSGVLYSSNVIEGEKLDLFGSLGVL